MWGLLLSLLPKAVGLLSGPVTQAITGINIPQVLSNVLGILNTALKFVVKHWQLSLVVVLAVGNIVGFTGWQHTDQALKAERAAHQADIKTYKDAQTKADAAAKAQEQSIINESKVKANAADANYSGLLAKYNASLLRYRTDQGGSQSASGHQGDNSQGQVAPSTDGPSGSSGLFITLKDAQICATNTARLVAAHDWAIHLGDNTDGS